MKNLSEKAWTFAGYAPPVATLLFASWVGLELNRRSVKADQKF